MTTDCDTRRGTDPRRAALLALPLAALLALAACSGSGERAPEAPDGAASAAGPASYMRYRMPSEPPTLDPHQSNDENSMLYIVNLFDGLVDLEPGGTAVVPALAESWTISPDGRTYTFKLRKGITFHNGRAIAADDVVYSLKRALDPKTHAPLAGNFGFIEGAKEFSEGKGAELPGVGAPDPGTVVIRLEHPYGPFLSLLTAPVGSVVPREAYDDPDRDYLRNPVGSGPFRFESWESGVSIKMAAFAGYWKGAPGLAGIDVRFIPDVTTAFEEYKTGGLDFDNEVPPGQRELARANLPGEYHAWPKLAIAAVGFNMTKEPFKGNLTLRRAFEFAVDRDRIANVLQEGKDQPAGTLIPPGLVGHAEGEPPYRYDPEEAKRLLAESGHPGGKGLRELVYLTPVNESIRRYAEAVQGDLAQIGVKVQVKSMDFTAFVTLATSPQGVESVDLFQEIYYADYPDPDGLLWPLLHSSSFAAGNFGHYASPEVDRLLEEGRVEADQAKRADIYRQVDAKAMEDASMIPIYFFGDDALLKPYIEGFRPSPMGDAGVPLDLLKDTRR